MGGRRRARRTFRQPWSPNLTRHDGHPSYPGQPSCRRAILEGHSIDRSPSTRPHQCLGSSSSSFRAKVLYARFTGGTPWICTWKCALRVWPRLPRFSNQMLRYQRMPTGLVHEIGLPAHRAMPDAYVTAHHLRDMLNETSLDDCLAWSNEPGLLPRVPAGADRGKPWDRISTETLNVLIADRDVDVRFSAQTELTRRHEDKPSQIAEPAQGTLGFE
ncbi:exodeoxyribonuclease X [Agrobacterium rosae]|uniref:Exodeoxyribonuclease X n=1 Tax=Agrobacterium rosae TaxID=1972867 RepID=A0A1R3TYM8_9HYPH|nr:exodeoxyribonuclease X [Agrobacterium rosae]